LEVGRVPGAVKCAAGVIALSAAPAAPDRCLVAGLFSPRGAAQGSRPPLRPAPAWRPRAARRPTSMERRFTVTGFVVEGDRTLLHWHRKLQMWLPPGGHRPRRGSCRRGARGARRPASRPEVVPHARCRSSRSRRSCRRRSLSSDTSAGPA
jgi:hypothetical protein